jgi:hypothetical protein
MPNVSSPASAPDTGLESGTKLAIILSVFGATGAIIWILIFYPRTGVEGRGETSAEGIDQDPDHINEKDGANRGLGRSGFSAVDIL